MLGRVWRFVVLFGAALSLFAASKPDFTGKWELAVDESNFGNAPKPARMTLEASNNDGVMHSVQTTYTAQEPETLEGNWYLDGKRHSSDKPAPGYSVTKWQDDTLVNERVSNDRAYHETTRLSLSRDGKTATEEVDSKTPNGTNHVKLIWHKQSS
ncbi:MAG TPA: hypothetical protein VH325_13415 [Bryobacteraceae bacterium]|jgi:hypothetical protein|nr:hypothetical protein [Bryobacteraceae bacterium]